MLMVAEKPSLAASIAAHLSGGKVSCRAILLETLACCPLGHAMHSSACFVALPLQMQSIRKAQEVHEWEGLFQGKPAHFRMTAVIGHVLSIDFPDAFQSWDKTDPATLFTAPTVKTEANPKVFWHKKTVARRVVPPLPKPPRLLPIPAPLPLLLPEKHYCRLQAHICRHLQQEARGCDLLVLWLDCDREGNLLLFRRPPFLASLPVAAAAAQAEAEHC